MTSPFQVTMTYKMSRNSLLRIKSSHDQPNVPTPPVLGESVFCLCVWRALFSYCIFLYCFSFVCCVHVCRCQTTEAETKKALLNPELRWKVACAAADCGAFQTRPQTWDIQMRGSARSRDVPPTSQRLPSLSFSLFLTAQLPAPPLLGLSKFGKTPSLYFLFWQKLVQT